MAATGPQQSVDETVRDLEDLARSQGISTAWSRYQEMIPQCSVGLAGACCKTCAMGPCNLQAHKAGVCGASSGVVVARNLARCIAGGTSAHSDHGRQLAEALLHVKPKEVNDTDKLAAVAMELGLLAPHENPASVGTATLSRRLGELLLKEFGRMPNESMCYAHRVPKPRLELWKKFGIAPRATDREVVDVMHRTTMGVDADPVSILLAGMRTALADGWSGSMLATDVTDILLGSPRPRLIAGNLGALRSDAVNLVVHGHEPCLVKALVQASKEPALTALAHKVGAVGGINLCGMCCTGHEALARFGVPMIGNFLQQELAIVTGAIEAMIVDFQCIMPALPATAACFHTKFISTSPLAHFPGTLHIEFREETGDETAHSIVRLAVENFANRNRSRVHIPEATATGMAGYCVESVLAALGGTLDPLIEAIKTGAIKGVAAVVGCNNVKVAHDKSHITIVSRLISSGILVITTGCCATACIKKGLLSLDACNKASKGLRTFCNKYNLPPVLHFGSCVDNSRILRLASALANALGVDISDLPVVGAAPEWMSEKAVAIGTYFVASGVTVLLGVVPPVLGSADVVRVLTSDLEKLMGAKFLVEPNPAAAAQLMEQTIMLKRKALNLPAPARL